MDKSAVNDPGVRWLRYLLVAFCLGGAVGRCFAPKEIADRIDWQFVLLVIAGGVILLLPYVSKLDLGKGGIKFEFTSEEKKALKKFGIGGRKDKSEEKSAVLKPILDRLVTVTRTFVAADRLPAAESKLSEAVSSVSSGDLQKGRWGGKDENRGYKLGARVDPIEDSINLFRLEVTVARVEPDPAEASTVRFHLHPTFKRSEVEVPIEKGQAKLQLVAWGAFTIGAEVLDSDRKVVATLELDLSKLPDAPNEFRER